MKTGGCCLPLHYGGPKAEYFARGALLFYKGSHSLVPPRAAGRTVAVRSVRRAKNKERKGAPYFLVDLKQNTSREGRYCFIRAHIRSCRRERRGELRQFVPSGAQKIRSAKALLIFWWTCAESNCGLTRFLRGSYTLSRRSVSRTESSPTTFPYACFRESLCGRGSQPPQRVPHWIDASFSPVGRRKETEPKRLGRKRYAASCTCSDRSSAFVISI